MSKTPKKPTLKYLLEWAKKNDVYIEIYRNGSAHVTWYRLKGIERQEVFGHSLYSALCKAHKEWRKDNE